MIAASIPQSPYSSSLCPGRFGAWAFLATRALTGAIALHFLALTFAMTITRPFRPIGWAFSISLRHLNHLPSLSQTCITSSCQVLLSDNLFDLTYLFLNVSGYAFLFAFGFQL